MLYRSAIIACARWENESIEEWLLYNFRLGVDHIYLYCNDDEPDQLQETVRRVRSLPSDFVTFRHSSAQGAQRTMYLDFLSQARNETEWVSFIDIDEFLVLKKHREIAGLINELDQCKVDSVHFNWLNFGNNGFVERPKGTILDKLTRRSKYISPNTKHLSRSAILNISACEESSFPFWHALVGDNWSNARRVNVIGAEVDELFKNFPASMTEYISASENNELILNNAFLAHYFMKSERDFVRRVSRGTQGEFSGQKAWSTAFNDGSWKTILQANNEVEDCSVLEK